MFQFRSALTVALLVFGLQGCSPVDGDTTDNSQGVRSAETLTLTSVQVNNWLHDKYGFWFNEDQAPDWFKKTAFGMALAEPGKVYSARVMLYANSPETKIIFGVVSIHPLVAFKTYEDNLIAVRGGSEPDCQSEQLNLHNEGVDAALRNCNVITNSGRVSHQNFIEMKLSPNISKGREVHILITLGNQGRNYDSIAGVAEKIIRSIRFGEVQNQ